MELLLKIERLGFLLRVFKHHSIQRNASPDYIFALIIAFDMFKVMRHQVDNGKLY